MYRKRFGLTCHPLPKNAQGKTFYDKSPGYQSFARHFQALLDDPGLGVLTAEPGLGKTAAVRNLCAHLPQPEYMVLYQCDTAVSPLDLYRTLAHELGVKPSHRRAQLWVDIKKALVHMVDERGTSPVMILDEAQHLSDHFLCDLSGFLNFAFDSRDLLTLWLVGLSPLAARLRMRQHAALTMRVAAQVHLEPLGRDVFAQMLEHALKAAGAQQKLFSDPAVEQLFRASRGIPRQTAKLVRAALRLAHERDQSFVDDLIVAAVVEDYAALAGTA